MEMGFARYYTPLYFWGVDALSMAVIALARYSKMWEERGAVRIPTILPYAFTPPLGSVKIDRRPELDEDDSLERERKLEGDLISSLERLCLPTYKASIWMRREK